MNKYVWMAIGAVAGSIATYIIMKDEFERIADEEIESVRESYKKREEAKQKVKENDEKKNSYMETLKEVTEKSGYFNYGSLASEAKKTEKTKDEKEKAAESKPEKHNIFKDYKDSDAEDEEDENEEKYYRELSRPAEKESDKPYTITPELFVQDKREYDKITLEYYDDGFLVEEISNDVVSDIASVIGYDSLNKFGEYEEDVVYVRNDVLETDYEVIRQHCNYSDS